jgi:hypothetical protein
MVLSKNNTYYNTTGRIFIVMLSVILQIAECLYADCHSGNMGYICVMSPNPSKLEGNDTQHKGTQNNDGHQHNDSKHYDAKYNDIQHNDSKHNDAKYYDIQHNGTQHHNTQHDNTKNDT